MVMSRFSIGAHIGVLRSSTSIKCWPCDAIRISRGRRQIASRRHFLSPTRQTGNQ